MAGRAITGPMGYSYVAPNVIAYVNRKYFLGPFFTKKSPSVQYPLSAECNTSQAEFGHTFVSPAAIPSDIFSLFSSQETQYKNTFTISMKDVVGKNGVY